MADITSPIPDQPVGEPPQPVSRRWLWIALAVIAGALVFAGVWRCSSSAEVPRVVGLTEVAAKQALEADGLEAGPVSEEATLAAAPGTVFQQSPNAGTQVPKGSSVRLVVAAAPTVDVPDVAGEPESEAEAALAAAGLRTGDVTGEYSNEAKAGLVLAQSPDAGMDVEVGSEVALTISLGVETGAVPDVVGLATTDAEEVLTAAGFAVDEQKTTSSEVDAGLVIEQDPAAGTVAESGTTVQVKVSTGPPAPEAPPEGAAEQSGTGANDGAGAAENPETPAEEPANPDEAKPPVNSETPAEPEAKPEPEPEPGPVQVAVPEIVGMRVLEALRELRQAKLGFKIAWGPTAEGFLQVIEQDPAAATEVDPGTVVTMTVGLPEFLFGGAEVQPLPSEPPTDDASTGEPSTGEPPAGDASVGEPPTAEQQPTEEQSATAP